MYVAKLPLIFKYSITLFIGTNKDRTKIADIILSHLVSSSEQRVDVLRFHNPPLNLSFLAESDTQEKSITAAMSM